MRFIKLYLNVKVLVSKFSKLFGIVGVKEFFINILRKKGILEREWFVNKLGKEWKLW